MKVDRDKLAIDFLTMRTVGEICKKHKISESTFYRIRREDGFMGVVKEQKDRMFLTTILTAQAASLEAMEALRDILADKDSPASARVSAAGRILDMAQDSFDAEAIIARVKQLEERLEASEKVKKISATR